jgi:DHA3 family tetracycline resistance protein-like MFS transporter
VPNPGAYRLFLIFSGATTFLFALAYTVAAVYRVQSAGLDPFQLVLVGTTLEVTYFLCNVPTGVVADTYSRRLSVIVGVFLWSVGLTLEGAIPLFVTILLAQVVMALGYTFVEGALEAWLSDEIGEENVGRTLLRADQIGRITAFAGIFGSVALASARLNLPLLGAGAFCFVFGVYVAATMREPHFQRPARNGATAWRARTRDALGEMATTTRTGAAFVRHRPLALTILAVAVIFGGFSEGFDRLWEAHFLTVIGLPALGTLSPIVWFGVIEAVALLLGIGGAEALRRLNVERPATAVRVLFVLEAALLAGVVLFALAGGFAAAVVAYWLASVTRSLVGPVYTAWINRGLDPRARATILSMSSQADALGQFTVGPALGALGSVFGLRVALTVAGLALTPALALYGRAIGKTDRLSDAKLDEPETAT